MSIFDGRVVIVTGAARGLGRDYARYFALDGANVVLADVKDTEAAAKDTALAGPECLGVETDVTDRASVEALMRQTEEKFGRLDVLVNNAGLWRGLNESGLLRCPDEVWERAWAVNVTGTLRCYQAAVPLMSARQWGRIINISSMASGFGGSPYGLTKNTVERMTAGMAHEVGELGITVNCVAPGISAFEAAIEQLPNADAIVANNAIKRMGTTRDLYGAMAYLCSPQAEWVTGQTIRVDGGGADAMTEAAYMVDMPVEWGKIREYALATGSHHPDYLENRRAPIPPTFLSTVVFWDEPGRGLRTPEAMAVLTELGVEGDMDMRNILSAEQEYRFTGPLPRAGERLWLSHRFDGAEVKEGRRGGRLVFTRFAVEFRDVAGALRAECLYTSVRTSQAATEAASS